MNNLRPLVSLLTLACAFALSACKTTDSAKSDPGNVLYVCACGADCKCTSVSTKPGKCGCGHELKAGHLCKVEADVALLCMCAPDCKCMLDAANPAQCGCGKPIRKVSLKGTGIYFCNCGGSCSCNMVSAAPATCKCGMALKKVD